MPDTKVFNKIYIKDDNAGIDKTILISTTADKVFFEDGTPLTSVIGVLNNLDTTNKSNIVSAINEVKADANDPRIGDLTNLETEEQTTLVGAINEVKNAAKPAFIRSDTAPEETSVFWIDTNTTTGGLKAYWDNAWRAVSVQYT